ncbi:hypothetical protein [Nonomuraea salmonea]|uniref:hypothetical protein n=1 Tax=Nonomuraea salmonea TaxID=46181 RepID=UPI0031E6641C
MARTRPLADDAVADTPLAPGSRKTPLSGMVSEDVRLRRVSEPGASRQPATLSSIAVAGSVVRSRSASAATCRPTAWSRCVATTRLCSATCLPCSTARPPAASATTSRPASAAVVSRLRRTRRLARPVPAARKSRSRGVRVMCRRPVAAQVSAWSRRVPWSRSPSLRPLSSQWRAASLMRASTARPSRSPSTHRRRRGQARSSAGRDRRTASSCCVTR